MYKYFLEPGALQVEWKNCMHIFNVFYCSISKRGEQKTKANYKVMFLSSCMGGGHLLVTCAGPTTYLPAAARRSPARAAMWVVLVTKRDMVYPHLWHLASRRACIVLVDIRNGWRAYQICLRRIEARTVHRARAVFLVLSKLIFHVDSSDLPVLRCSYWMALNYSRL
jgi:hypothetical protein